MYKVNKIPAPFLLATRWLVRALWIPVTLIQHTVLWLLYSDQRFPQTVKSVTGGFPAIKGSQTHPLPHPLSTFSTLRTSGAPCHTQRRTNWPASGLDYRGQEERIVLTFAYSSAGTRRSMIELCPWWGRHDPFPWAPSLPLPGHLDTFHDLNPV